jgi:uncharacterized protein (TIGR02217 family)
MVGYVIDNVRLPVDVEREVEGGPGFRTTIITLDSGFEHANINWERTRGRWQCGYGVDGPDVWSTIIAFYRARFGMARGFRFKDWSDYEIEDQQIGTGDGTTQNFQIYKRYADTVLPFDRPITHPVEATIAVTLDDVPTAAWTLLAGGIIRFTVAPSLAAVIKITCEFDVPVRFDTDIMQVNLIWEQAGSIPLFNVVEVRV